MFNTTIHWTTFFYLLIDTAIVLFVLFRFRKSKNDNLSRLVYLGFLFILFNLSVGFLPSSNFPGPLIFQYIIIYVVSMTLCLYIIYYLYKEFDITILEYNSSLRNLSILVGLCFILLFLIPYFLTDSIAFARPIFKIPISLVAIAFLIIFYKRISNPLNPNAFILRRNKLSLLSIISITLLPIITVTGSYQWLTSTVMNIAFYAITIIEVDRYHYSLKNQFKMYEAILTDPGYANIQVHLESFSEKLTRREIQISLSILGDMKYEEIANNLFIQQSTVTKHASNIFRKLGVKNRRELIKKFKSKK